MRGAPSAPKARIPSSSTPSRCLPFASSTAPTSRTPSLAHARRGEKILEKITGRAAQPRVNGDAEALLRRSADRGTEVLRGEPAQQPLRRTDQPTFSRSGRASAHPATLGSRSGARASRPWAIVIRSTLARMSFGRYSVDVGSLELVEPRELGQLVRRRADGTGPSAARVAVSPVTSAAAPLRQPRAVPREVRLASEAGRAPGRSASACRSGSPSRGGPEAAGRGRRGGDARGAARSDRAGRGSAVALYVR